VQRLHRSAKALGTGSRDGIAFFAYASREGTCEGMAQKPPDLRPVAREERRAEAVQVVEHALLRVRT
jgi:hypothetical protein